MLLIIFFPILNNINPPASLPVLFSKCICHNVLSLVDYEKKSESLATQLVSHRNTTEPTSSGHSGLDQNPEMPVN